MQRAYQLHADPVVRAGRRRRDPGLQRREHGDAGQRLTVVSSTRRAPRCRRRRSRRRRRTRSSSGSSEPATTTTFTAPTGMTERGDIASSAGTFKVTIGGRGRGQADRRGDGHPGGDIRRPGRQRRPAGGARARRPDDAPDIPAPHPGAAPGTGFDFQRRLKLRAARALTTTSRPDPDPSPSAGGTGDEAGAVIPGCPGSRARAPRRAIAGAQCVLATGQARPRRVRPGSGSPRRDPPPAILSRPAPPR